MACTSPLHIPTEFGQIKTRCKQCLQCRIVRQGALTLQNLMEFHTSSTSEFWTLTYKEAPETGDYSDFRNFLKRYRSYQTRQGNLQTVRFFACGEYGTKSGRFHYHALLYNVIPPITDRCLTRLWPHGFVRIGTVTPASISYTARYCLKFEEKGRSSHAGWSRRPVLGTDGMKYLASYMARRGDDVKEIPTYLGIGGRTFPLSTAMREVFDTEWTRVRGRSIPNRSKLYHHFEYKRDIHHPEFTKEQRKIMADRKEFFNSARIVERL